MLVRFLCVSAPLSTTRRCRGPVGRFSFSTPVSEIMNTQRHLFTVTELTRRIKELLETGLPSLLIQGEVSNLKRHASGHIYFTIKDEHAQISAVLWRSRAALSSFIPEDGIRVVVGGRLTVYEPRGSYQIEVSSIRPYGVGEMQLAFEQLKQKLAAEGLFDPRNKKPLPEYPERIGLVTSPSGAALHDIVQVLKRRFPAVELILNPVRVQGEGAAEEIARAIREFNEYGMVDVLIVGRGGGSIEDLWAYNEEVVAREIYNSQIPLVSAVGHETDFTIADFVADLRAPTPSVAAELVVKDRSAVFDNLRKYWYTMHESIQSILDQKKENIRYLLKSYSFHRPIDILKQSGQRVDELERSMKATINHRLALLKSTAGSLHQRLTALDPTLTLKRGYTMIRREGKIVASSKTLRQKDSIDIAFHDGVIRSTVS